MAAVLLQSAGYNIPAVFVLKVKHTKGCQIIKFTFNEHKFFTARL